AKLVKTLDPTRLVIANSGVNCCFSRPDSGAGDVYDDHTYVGPGTPSVRGGRAIVDGEYGGLGLVLDDHRWPGPPNAYEMTSTQERLTERYAEVSAALERVVAERGLSGAVYTQTTDVENEVNGLLTYDRRVVKVDPEVVAKCVRAVIEMGSS
ncbi:glycoside hydrolase family 2, partial [Amycolatopsis tolypomycina]